MLTDKRTINGMLVDGYNGDSIRLLIDKNGVSNYYRLWRDIKSNDGNIKANNSDAKSNDNNIKKFIASGQALENAKRNAYKIYKVSNEWDKRYNISLKQKEMTLGYQGWKDTPKDKDSNYIINTDGFLVEIYKPNLDSHFVYKKWPDGIGVSLKKTRRAGLLGICRI